MAFPEHVERAGIARDRPRLADLQRVIADDRVPGDQFPARFRTPELTAQLPGRALAHWSERGFGPRIVRREGELIGRAGLMTAAFEAGFSELGLHGILAWTMTTDLPDQQGVMAAVARGVPRSSLPRGPTSYTPRRAVRSIV